MTCLRFRFMAHFDRFDIACAYAALEHDWNVGGMLQERSSNQRRRESVGVQLHRMGFRPALDEAAGFSALAKSDSPDNRREIYVEALLRMGLGPEVDPEDDLGRYIRTEFTEDWVRQRVPHLLEATPGSRARLRP